MKDVGSMSHYELGIRVGSKVYWCQNTNNTANNQLSVFLHLSQQFSPGYQGVLIEGDWVIGKNDLNEVDTIDHFKLWRHLPLPRLLMPGTDVDISIRMEEDGASEVVAYVPILKWESKLKLSETATRKILESTKPSQPEPAIDSLPPALRSLVNFYSQS